MIDFNFLFLIANFMFFKQLNDPNTHFNSNFIILMLFDYDMFWAMTALMLNMKNDMVPTYL